MLSFLASPAITLAYYLFVFFSIEASLIIALWQYRRLDSFRAYRLAVAFGSLTILRVMLLLLAVLSRSSPDIAAYWIPPFERVVAITSLGFLVWGFTPYFREKGVAGTTLLAVNTVFAFIFYFIAVWQWRGDDFNQSNWEIFFIAWQMLLALFGVINCFMKLDDERMFAMISFGTLFAGYLLHLFLGGNYSQPHDPFWVRLSELIAYPLFAVAIYHGAIQSLSARSRQYQNLSEISIDQVKGLISLYEATRSITSTLELSHVLDGAARSVARALETDQCAIALPENEGDLSYLRLVSIHNPSRKGRGESVTFPVNDQQAIKHALKRKYQVVIDEYRDNSQIRMLFTLMGAGDVGPLVIQPLLENGEPIGVLILGNAISKRHFSQAETDLCRTLADQITVAIGHAREYAGVSAKSQHLSWTLRNQELESGKRLAAMESELKKSREEVALFAQRMQAYETEQKRLEQETAQYEQRLAELADQAENARAEAEKSQSKGKKLLLLATQYEAQKQQLQKLSTERDGLLIKVEKLEQDAEEIDRLNEALTTSTKRARALARKLKNAQNSNQQIVAARDGVEAGAALEDLSCGVIITDARQSISRVNEVASSMLNLNSRQLVGNLLAEAIHDEQWQKTVSQVRQHHENMVTTTLKVNDRILRATLSPIASTDEPGKEGIVTILYDITAEAESQQARDEFIASLSQELRTPMTSITGYTDLLVGESVGMIGDMQRKFLQRIKANIERMNIMLNDLIGVTAIDAGQLEIRPSVVDIVEVIEDTIIGARAQLEENELSLDMNMADDIPPVEADPDSVRQIMNNLLGNAIKASPVGSSIAIATAIYHDESDPGSETPPAFLKISVKDSGGGIAEKDIDRVFERFYRAERPLIEGLGETGVGLSIVKSLVEAHGGRVWVETEIGDGSTFHFILPVSEQFDDPWLEVDIPPLDLNVD
ncbi:MAG: hypothetical protein Kow0031_11850 [Anaerolineae bacterium]